MVMIEWNDSYSAGVEQIDQQHRAFLALINRLSILQERGTPPAMTRRVLLELLKYTEYHFVSEENLMILTECPLLPQQQLEHSKLLQTMAERYEAFGKGQETLESILKFLVRWFTTHTSDLDKAAGFYINKYARGHATE
jgi:hemerythrin